MKKSTVTSCVHVRLFTVAALVALGLTNTGAAYAQTPENRAAAQKMFDDAKALMESRKFAEACALLEESQKLDPGMAAQFRLGECYEKAGRLASAWSTFVEVASAARATAMADRERVARERAEALKPKLSYITINVPEAVATTPGLAIKRDGITIGRPQWGAGVPVDPGTHAIEASAPDKKPWASQVKVHPAPGTTTVTVPVLMSVAAAPPATPGRLTEPPAWSTQRTVGLVVGGVGVVGAVVGTIFGVRSFGKSSDSEAHCTTGMPDLCDDMGLELRSDATEAANVSTVAFVLGGAAVVAGVVLFVAAPSGDASASGRVRLGVRVGSMAGPSTTGILLHGGW